MRGLRDGYRDAANLLVKEAERFESLRGNELIEISESEACDALFDAMLGSSSSFDWNNDVVKKLSDRGYRIVRVKG
jgi:hypothetical protein